MCKQFILRDKRLQSWRTIATTISEKIKKITAVDDEIAALAAEINYYKELGLKPMTVEELQAAIKKAAGLSNKNDTAFFALMDRVDHDDADVCTAQAAKALAIS
jgi:hypothetical protein